MKKVRMEKDVKKVRMERDVSRVLKKIGVGGVEWARNCEEGLGRERLVRRVACLADVGVAVCGTLRRCARREAKRPKVRTYLPSTRAKQSATRERRRPPFSSELIFKDIRFFIKKKQ